MKTRNKLLALSLVMTFLFAFAACGEGKKSSEGATTVPDPTAADAAETAESEAPAEEDDPYVDVIDYELDDGTLKYVRFEKAVPGLVEEENAYVFVFEYTNHKTDPSQAQNTFAVKFFQNGVELESSSSYSSKGGDQYELARSFFKEALKGGTVTFGKIVLPLDDSPVTVLVRRNGGGKDERYQMMEVSLTAEPAAEGSSENDAEELSAEQIDALLQGTWTLQGANEFTFENGKLSIVSSGKTIGGTYQVNTETKQIDGDLIGTDGIVHSHIDYKLENGALVLYNKTGEAFVKQ